MSYGAERVEDGVQAWLAFERRTGIHETEVDGFLLWNAIRFALFSRQVQLSLGGGVKSGDVKTGDVNRAGPSRRERAQRYLGALRPRPADDGIAPVRTLLVPHSRRVALPDGRRVCAFTEPLLPASGRRDLVLIEPPVDSQPLESATWWDSDGTKRELSARWRRPDGWGAVSALSWLRRWEPEIERFLGWPDASARLRRRVAILLRKRALWQGPVARWLDQSQPQRVLLVVHYADFCQIVMHEARARRIPIWELQHGVIDEEHLAYAHVRRPRVFPDRILLFGDAWRAAAAHLPLATDATPAIGFAMLNQERADVLGEGHVDAAGVEPPALRVLFLNQWPLGTSLAKWAIEIAERLPEHAEIRFRLHPQERAGWTERLGLLVDHPRIDVGADASPVHTDLQWATHQVGVNSTALCEGLAFGCRTILATGLPGGERYRFLIDRGLAVSAARPTDAARSIVEGEVPEVDPALASDLWAEEAEVRFRRLLEDASGGAQGATTSFSTSA